MSENKKRKRKIRLPKNTWKILSFAFLIFFVILIIFLLSLQSSRMQTFLTQKVADFLSDEIHKGITVGKVDIEFFNKIVLKKVFIKDNKGDTLLYLKTLKADIIEIDNENSRLYLDEIFIDGLKLKVIKSKKGKTNYNFANILFNKKTKIKFLKASTEKEKDWKFDFKKLKIINSSVSYKDENAKKHHFKNIFNKNDFFLENIYFSIDNFKNDSDTLTFKIEKINFLDKSGFYLKNFSSQHKISPKTIEYKNLKIETSNSKIFSKILKIDFDSIADLKNKNPNIAIEFLLKKSKISLKDISYFVPKLYGLENDIFLETELNGKLGDLHCTKLNFYFEKETELICNFVAKDITDFKKSNLYFNIEKFITNESDLEKIKVPPFEKKKNLKLPKEFGNLGKIFYSGSFTKLENDFIIKNKFNTDLGNINLDIFFRPLEDWKVYNFKGNIFTEHFNLGKLIYPKKSKQVFEIGIKNELKGVFKDKNLKAEMNGIILKMLFDKYLYKNIQINSNFDKNKIDGYIIIDKENPFLSGKFTFDFKFKDLF